MIKFLIVKKYWIDISYLNSIIEYQQNSILITA
nr:MAG TPA: hypothetical protein [Microviridae sp.]